MIRMARDDAGSGAPVLLLHGFPTTRKLWAGVSSRLALAGLRAIAPDLVGYGDSPDADDVGMESQATWLLELLDELRLEQVLLVAHDVGTAAAQLVAIRAPRRVRKLVLMDGVHETEWAMGAVESIRSWDASKAARLEPVLARRLPSIRDLLGAYAGESGGRRLIHAARCLDPRQTAGATARLRATGIPVRLLWGDADDFLPADRVAEPLARELGAELRLLRGGHFLPHENPDAVARELLAYA